MLRIGDATVIPKELEFEWKINDFFSKWHADSLMPTFDSKFYSSPLFSFVDTSWCLEMHPNEDQMDNKAAYMGVCLIRKSSGPPVTMKYSINLKSSDNKKYLEKHFKKTFEEKNSGYGDQQYLLKAELLNRRSDLMLSNALTIVCSMKCPNFAEAKAGKMFDDLKDMMDNGNHSDTTIQVKGKEFRLHRNILGARSPFFDSMFKSTSTLSIDDCDLDIFYSFIQFIYTGKVNEMSVGNVCDLYEVASKYQQEHLKEECLQFMLNSMSVTSFCDFIIVALKHDNKKLLEKAIALFAGKTKEIVFSMKWVAFLNEYPSYANEFHLRAIEADKNSMKI